MSRCSPARCRRSSPRDRTQAESLVIVTSLLACLWLVFTASLAWAAPPSEAGKDSGSGEAQVEPESEPNAEQTKIEDLRRRASGITALIAGELEPEVEVEALLSIDLREPEGGQLQALLESISEAREARAAAEKGAKGRRKPPKAEVVAVAQPPPLPETDADSLAWAQAELLRAHWQFWTLPTSERAALLEAHEAKQRSIVENQEAAAAANDRLERLQRESRQIAELIAGDLDVSVDPAPLLRVSLGAVGELGSDGRLARALGAEPDSDSPHAMDPPKHSEQGWRPSPELSVQLATAAAELDGQRLRFSALDLDQRRALIERHEARQTQAAEQTKAAELEALTESDELAVTEELADAVEEDMSEAVDKAAQAKREREQAQVAAGRARSEALRRVAEERARLLGVKEAHAVYEVELTQRRRDTVAAHEVALEWDRRATELAQTLPGDSREQQADAMYGDLRKASADVRERLRGTLRTIASADSGVMPVGDALSGLPSEVDRGDLSELRSELEASEQALIELEREVVWAAADGGRDDSVMLNQARLMVLDLASNELRSRMTGFGSDGVLQVKRELEQIVLELRYRVVSLPRLGRGLLEDLETSPLPLLFGLVQLGFAIAVFRYWQKQAEPTLERMRDNLLTREQGNPRINAGLALVIWYFEKIRRPLEWLALFAVVFRVLLSGGDVLELEVLWLVVLWLNLGYTVILFVDAVAAHESLVYGRGNNLTAQLRIRSLRLVGLTVVLTGLVLSMTEETVGRGAIHKWVRSLIWIAAVPILLVLIRWWRDHVFRRIQSDKDLPDSMLLRWIRANTEGWASFPAAAIAGAYLFSRGLMRWSLRRATSFEVTRRLLAWMFRREVARQASARQENEQPVRPLVASDYPEFNPARIVESVDELSEPMRAIGAELLAEIIALKTTQRGTISAVIGGRGAGKSTFLRRLAAALEDRAEDYVHEPAAPDKAPAETDRHAEFGVLTVRRIQCPPGGFRQLQRTIAEAIGLPRNAAREQLVEALSHQTPLVFLIDDAHRLVRPAIGGLAGLDQFADFAREVSGDASWITSIGASAWQYVSRARGDRVFFDQVLKLPAWNEQQIGALIRDRCAAAGLSPNFSDIVIPRQFDVSTVAEGEERPTEERRAELGYYRILWDYAKGNPGVAIHFWRESLWITDDDQVRVRLFKEPSVTDLDAVGATMHFVLRGVVQLEVASPADLVACTQLPPPDVADALRFALARGWIDKVGSYGDRYRVTWHWYPPIINVLRRQHLLEI